ncbi:hypothetical protein B0H10DRAFT_2235559 [Mycena sp. CBHHK59/15]|nr:hypothetical protein B0H10DRAFT_2235559 [Mycena sp. CBHHK59/15]
MVLLGASTVIEPLVPRVAPAPPPRASPMKTKTISSAVGCPGQDLPLKEGAPSFLSSPLALHAERDLPWNVEFGLQLIIRSHEYKRQAEATGVCFPCEKHLRNHIIKGIIQRNETDINPGTRFSYLTVDNAQTLLRKKNSQINSLKLAGLTLSQTLLVRATHLAAHSRLQLAVSRGDVPRIHSIVSNCIKIYLLDRKYKYSSIWCISSRGDLASALQITLIIYPTAGAKRTSKILIGDTTFYYDDLAHRGSLVAQGGADLISTPDSKAVLWLYHRTSKIAQSSKSFRDLVSMYNEAKRINSSCARPSPSIIDNSPPPELPKDPSPVNPVPADWAIDPEHSDGWMCASCDESLLNPVAVWSDELIGEYLMFRSRLTGGFYPACLEGLTSTGEVRLKWYRDNIYDRLEIPLETEFLATKQQCANIAAANADVTYEKDNVGMIKWPPRLTEDAQELFGYENLDISDTLLHSRQFILDIIIGSPSALHPIGPDYEQWMVTGGELRDVGHANDFVHKFFSAQILPGDASLIGPHTDYVVQSIPPDVPAAKDDPATLSEGLRRRATILASILFQLVILRIFNPDEWEKISADDPLYLAKQGTVTRHLTDPERVLQAPEESSGQNIPARWCKIGTRVAKAAAACIPAKFILATACDPMGEEYIWQDTNSTGIKRQAVDFGGEDPKSHPSSPLSEPPAAMDYEPSPPPELTNVEPPKKVSPVETLKRKNKEPLGSGAIPDEEGIDPRDASNAFGALMQPDNDDADGMIDDLHRANIQAMKSSSNSFFAQPPRHWKVVPPIKMKGKLPVKKQLEKGTITIEDCEEPAKKAKKPPKKKKHLSLRPPNLPKE